MGIVRAAGRMWKSRVHRNEGVPRISLCPSDDTYVVLYEVTIRRYIPMQLLMHPRRCDTRAATFSLIGNPHSEWDARLRASRSYRGLMKIAEKRVLDPRWNKIIRVRWNSIILEWLFKIKKTGSFQLVSTTLDASRIVRKYRYLKDIFIGIVISFGQLDVKKRRVTARNLTHASWPTCVCARVLFENFCDCKNCRIIATISRYINGFI